MKVLESVADEQILIAAAQRDPALFAELYENNFDRVYAFIARRVPSPQDAEDLTSEVFHQALRNLARFEWQGFRSRDGSWESRVFPQPLSSRAERLK